MWRWTLTTVHRLPVKVAIIVINCSSGDIDLSECYNMLEISLKVLTYSFKRWLLVCAQEVCFCFCNTCAPTSHKLRRRGGGGGCEILDHFELNCFTIASGSGSFTTVRGVWAWCFISANSGLMTSISCALRASNNWSKTFKDNSFTAFYSKIAPSARKKSVHVGWTCNYVLRTQRVFNNNRPCFSKISPTPGATRYVVENRGDVSTGLFSFSSTN